MSTVPPPSYSVNAASMIDAKIQELKPPSVEDQVAAEEALVKHVKTPEAKATLKKEIEDLAGAVLSIDASFRNIGNSFKRMIASGGDASANLTKQIDSMNTEWDATHKQYVNFVVASRRIAAKARAVASDFATDFADRLSDRSVKPEEKKADIKDYIQELKEQGSESALMAIDFQNLGNSVTLFKLKWEDFVKNNPVGEMEKSIKTGEERIVSLTDQITALDSKIKKLQIALGITAGATGITAILGIICPLFWIGTAIGAVATIVEAALLANAQKERSALVKDRADEMKRVKTLKADVALLNTIQSELVANGKEFENIVNRLSSFNSVWARISSDITFLETKLDLTESSGGAMFYIRLNTVRTLYATLAEALETYAVTIDVESLPKH